MRLCVFPSGERYPALIRRDTGLPLIVPNLFVVTQLRPKHFAAATLECCQHALKLLLLFADAEGIDLAERVESGKMLASHELDALADAAQRYVRDIVDPPRRLASREPTRVADRIWSSQGQRTRSTQLETTRQRLWYIRKFLKWWVHRRRGRLIDRPDAFRSYAQRSTEFLRELGERIPPGGHRDSERCGLPRDYYQRVLDAIDPAAPSPIWSSPAARLRNFVMLQFYWRLGLRDGEVRSLLVSDIDIGRDEFWVERRPDAIADPRRRAPTVKTDGRLLPLMGLGSVIEQYLFEVRQRTTRARRHPYLFVATRTGAPLSASGVSKVFRDVASAVRIPEPFSPHILRHTWNDRFSSDQDAAHASEEQEQRSRNYAQGWKANSVTSRLYTKRHDQRRAFEALDRMGRDLLRGASR